MLPHVFTSSYASKCGTMWYPHESICFIMFHPTRHQCVFTGDARLTSSLLRGPFALRKGSLRRSPGVSRDFPWFQQGIWEKSGSFWAPAISLQHPSISFNTLQPFLGQHVWTNWKIYILNHIDLGLLTTRCVIHTQLRCAPQTES